jgi:hypothetical protein
MGPAGLAAVAMLTIDLAVANAPLVITVPQADFDREPAVVRAIRDAERAGPSPGPFRVQRLPSWVPIGWGSTASTDRLRELLNWEIDTLQPSFGLLHGTSYVFDDESETGRDDYRRLFRPSYRVLEPELSAALGVGPGRPVLYYPRAAFDLWGARYFIVPSYPGDWTREDRGYAAFVDQTDLIYPDPAAMEGAAHVPDRQRWLLTRDVLVRRNRAAFPRAWVVHEARLVPPLDQAAADARDGPIARLRSDGPADIDFRTTAYVETERPSALAPYLPGGSGRDDADEAVTVHSESSTRVVIEARARRPGIVVLADTFDPGWRLTIDGRPAPVLRANFLMRGAAVTAGPHTLVYAYRPASVLIGAIVSLAGLTALGGLALWARRRPVARTGP